MVPKYDKIIDPLLRLMSEKDLSCKSASDHLSITFKLSEDELQERKRSLEVICLKVGLVGLSHI